LKLPTCGQRFIVG